MFVSQPFDAVRHDISQFDCGKPELNHWLRAGAGRDQKAGQCRVNVWTADRSDRVIAFYSIAPHFDTRDATRGSRKFHSGYSVIPGYLLGRLALDTSLQGQGFGSELLLEAATAALAASRVGAGRVLYVDVLDEDARSFYAAHDFTQTAKANRMWIRLIDLEQTLGHPGG